MDCDDDVMHLKVHQNVPQGTQFCTFGNIDCTVGTADVPVVIGINSILRRRLRCFVRLSQRFSKDIMDASETPRNSVKERAWNYSLPTTNCQRFIIGWDCIYRVIREKGKRV